MSRLSLGKGAFQMFQDLFAAAWIARQKPLLDAAAGLSVCFVLLLVLESSEDPASLGLQEVGVFISFSGKGASDR